MPRRSRITSTLDNARMKNIYIYIRNKNKNETKEERVYALVDSSKRLVPRLVYHQKKRVYEKVNEVNSPRYPSPKTKGKKNKSRKAVVEVEQMRKWKWKGGFEERQKLGRPFAP